MTTRSSREDIMKQLDEKAREYLRISGNCAQSSFSALSDQFGLGDSQIRKALSPFPGIALRGETCGVVIGSLMALGLFYGEEDPGPSPEDEWQRLEMEILRNDDPTWKTRLTGDRLPGVYQDIYRELTVWCERLARSLSRLFTIGGLGDLARQISPNTHHFLFLADSDLGTTDYAALVI